MLSKFLQTFFALLLSVFALAEDDLEKAKATDTANMKKIWEALSAFKKAKGDYPLHLHELVPDFLPDAKVFVSPLGADKNMAKIRGEYDPKVPSSYAYALGTEKFPFGTGSFREANTAFLDEFGPTLPILSCFLHRKILHISHAGDFFESNEYWQKDPEVEPLRQKNGSGPGMQKGKKLKVTLTDPTGKPLPGLPLQATKRSYGRVVLPERSLTTDEHGAATVPLGPDTEPVVFLKCATGEWFLHDHRWRFGDEGTQPDSDTATISIVVQPAGTGAGGIVRDAEGVPLKGTLIRICELAKSRQFNDRIVLATTTTDENGRWKIGSVPRTGEKLHLVVTHPGKRTQFVKFFGTSSQSAEALFAQTAEVRLAPPIMVSGTVSCAGQPISEAKVYLRSWTPLFDLAKLPKAVTDAQGHFEIPVAEEGENRLIVVAKDFAPSSSRVEITENGKPVEIVLERGRRLTGRVIRAVGGKPSGVPDIPVFFSGFESWPGPLPEKLLMGTTDETGRFVWDHAPRAMISCSYYPPSGEEVFTEWDTTKDDEFGIELDEDEE